MKGKVTIELERFVLSALRGMESLTHYKDREPPKDFVCEAQAFVRGVIDMIPIDRGEHYRQTEAKVLREIAARTPEHVRKHFYILREAHIEEVAKEVA